MLNLVAVIPVIREPCEAMESPGGGYRDLRRAQRRWIARPCRNKTLTYSRSALISTFIQENAA
ncbi:MAG: hypothetical protein R3F44_18495 [Candidatus Competibacteraceae bacterium]